MGVKISELQEKTAVNPTDVMPVVDTGTKKMKLSTLLSLIFPIGSTYITQTDVNPNTILGFGTWERLKGRVCVGLDEDDTDFNEIGKTGGEKTHTLTVDEIPSHSHSLLTESGSGNKWALKTISGVGQFTSKEQIQSTGGSKAHNNLQPYQVVGYMWIRKS